MNVKTLSVNCPTCKKEVLMTDASPHRPFCSKRCRDIDFGEWATESYKIPEKTQDSDVWSESISPTDESH